MSFLVLELRRLDDASALESDPSCNEVHFVGYKRQEKLQIRSLAVVASQAMQTQPQLTRRFQQDTTDTKSNPHWGWLSLACVTKEQSQKPPEAKLFLEEYAPRGPRPPYNRLLRTQKPHHLSLLP